uniref:Glycosyl transferase 64 domain-containing protein n=1 Tax=Kalanchoe fedtschenkoi TaxID=63787 RepID=A0A7N1A0A5_KALFE
MSPIVRITNFSIFIFLMLPFTFSSTRLISASPCDRNNQNYTKYLRSDQITVLINGYSEHRIPLLTTIAATYAASPSVSSVIVLWGNPSTPSKTLTHLAHNLSVSYSIGSPVTLIRQKSSSLNLRFLPRRAIATRAVLICDDDVEVDSPSLEFAFRVWRSNPDRLIGIFARSHDLDLSTKSWIYTVHPHKYSILLTKFMILAVDYLHAYTCGGGPGMDAARTAVDRMRNCEDILMNFVVADVANAGPILVGAEKARDWGDARNDDRDEDGRLGLTREVGSRVRQVGLSSRRSKHRKRRGECITKFHKALGKVPLRLGSSLQYPIWDLFKPAH